MRLLSLLLLGGCLDNPPAPSAPPIPPPEAPPAREDNMWLDRATGRWWLKGQVLVTWLDAQEACEGEFEIASAQELRSAWARGLCRAPAQGGELDPPQACPKAWAASVTTTQAMVFDMSSGEITVAGKGEAIASTYCVTKETPL